MQGIQLYSKSLKDDYCSKEFLYVLTIKILASNHKDFIKQAFKAFHGDTDIPLECDFSYEGEQWIISNATVFELLRGKLSVNSVKHLSAHDKYVYEMLISDDDNDTIFQYIGGLYRSVFIETVENEIAKFYDAFPSNIGIHYFDAIFKRADSLSSTKRMYKIREYENEDEDKPSISISDYDDNRYVCYAYVDGEKLISVHEYINKVYNTFCDYTFNPLIQIAESMYNIESMMLGGSKSAWKEALEKDILKYCLDPFFIGFKLDKDNPHTKCFLWKDTCNYCIHYFLNSDTLGIKVTRRKIGTLTQLMEDGTIKHHPYDDEDYIYTANYKGENIVGKALMKNVVDATILAVKALLK